MPRSYSPQRFSSLIRPAVPPATILIALCITLSSCSSKNEFGGTPRSPTPQKIEAPTNKASGESVVNAESKSAAEPAPRPLQRCMNKKVIGEVKPSELWAWKDTNFKLTYSSPVAGDLDRDGSVEVVTIGSGDDYSDATGRMSVVDGKTGALKWQPGGIAALASTTPALLDLDNDGWAEIITTEHQTGDKKNVVAINYKTKSVHFRTPVDGCGSYCMVAVADIDADGSPEIVAGDSILDAQGKLKKKLSVASKFIPTVADLMPSRPGLEIIVNGNTVLSSSGEKILEVPCATGSAQPFSAIADLDLDKKPELICVGIGSVNVFSNDGSKKWATALPTNGSGKNSGGAPNVGDFNGDGFFEVGVAGGHYYTVFSHTGEILWKKESKDYSSSSTGSTIFDFNGDGKVEVVYNDEDKLRIYDGTSGNILWETENPSGTLWEYPIIVNLDDTPSAEILVSSPSNGGIRAFHDPSKQWVNTRKIWNQYSYYPQIVSDLLTLVNIPGIPVDGFRINTQGLAELVCTP